MALQINYYYPLIETTIYNAYWRINPKNGLVGGKDGINYVIEVYKNVDAAHVENSQPIDRQTFNFVPDITGGADNFIAQAYLHAKSLPYFSGSLDV
jgi:hypothetical protein